jgi:hypothetical protein
VGALRREIGPQHLVVVPPQLPRRAARFLSREACPSRVRPSSSKRRLSAPVCRKESRPSGSSAPRAPWLAPALASLLGCHCRKARSKSGAQAAGGAATLPQRRQGGRRAGRPQPRALLRGRQAVQQGGPRTVAGGGSGGRPAHRRAARLSLRRRASAQYAGKVAVPARNRRWLAEPPSQQPRQPAAAAQQAARGRRARQGRQAAGATSCWRAREAQVLSRKRAALASELASKLARASEVVFPRRGCRRGRARRGGARMGLLGLEQGSLFKAPQWVDLSRPPGATPDGAVYGSLRRTLWSIVTLDYLLMVRGERRGRRASARGQPVTDRPRARSPRIWSGS